MDLKEVLPEVFEEVKQDYYPDLSKTYKPENKFFIVAIVGMGGAGKSAVAKCLNNYNFISVRFGDVTDSVLRRASHKLGKELLRSEKNERPIREELRVHFGMNAYAKLNIKRINEVLKISNVTIDGLYSWAEYKTLKQYYGDRFVTLAIWSPPEVRYKRTEERMERKRTREECITRDYSEIENIEKAGPIAMGSYLITNRESTPYGDLFRKAEGFLKSMRRQHGFDIDQKELKEFK